MDINSYLDENMPEDLPSPFEGAHDRMDDGRRMGRGLQQDKCNNLGGTQTMYSVEAALALGGICCKCGEGDLNALEIDHIHGDGKKERHQTSKTKMLKSIISLGSQGKYQLLCGTCHNIKSAKERGVDKNAIAAAVIQNRA